ncbi:FAD-dependent oxidoreductase [Spirillospora sp. NPDC050679]
MGWHEKSWHLDEHVGGGYAALPDLGSADGHPPMPSEPVGDLHWAGTETASEHAGYIEGAIESGERAAHEVIESLALRERRTRWAETRQTPPLRAARAPVRPDARRGRGRRGRSGGGPGR